MSGSSVEQREQPGCLRPLLAERVHEGYVHEGLVKGRHERERVAWQVRCIGYRCHLPMLVEEWHFWGGHSGVL